jgi:hypothetical protein
MITGMLIAASYRGTNRVSIRLRRDDEPADDVVQVVPASVFNVAFANLEQLVGKRYACTVDDEGVIQLIEAA